MGIIPAICLLTLLSLNSGDATSIKIDVLTSVVRRIQWKTVNKVVPGQISFLMVLDNEQCSSGMDIFGTKLSVPQGPEKGLNYIIDVYSDVEDWMGTGKKVRCCSEYNLLKVQTETKMTPAQTFGKMINEQKVLAKGGSVIFFTTNSPCTSRCFGDDPNWNIISPLIDQAPFDNWANQKNIAFYFVYLRPYVPIKFLRGLPLEQRMQMYNSMQEDTSMGFRKLETSKIGWNIARCDWDTKTCIFGNKKNNYAANWPQSSKIMEA